MAKHRRPDPWAPIIVGCYSAAAAHTVALSLREDGGRSDIEVDDRLVRVPWDGDPKFLTAIFEGARKLNAIAPETAATAMATRLAEIERRKGKS